MTGRTDTPDPTDESLDARIARLADQGYRIDLRPGSEGDRTLGGTLAYVVTPEGTEIPAGSRDDRDSALRAAVTIAETDAAQPRT